MPDGPVYFDFQSAQRIKRAVAHVRQGPRRPPLRGPLRTPRQPVANLVRVTGAISGGFYPGKTCAVQTVGTIDDVDGCYVLDPNNITLRGLYYVARLIGSHAGSPLYCVADLALVVEGEIAGSPSSVSPAWKVQFQEDEFDLTPNPDDLAGAQGIRLAAVVSGTTIDILTELCPVEASVSGVTWISDLTAETRTVSPPPTQTVGAAECFTSVWAGCCPEDNSGCVPCLPCGDDAPGAWDVWPTGFSNCCNGECTDALNSPWRLHCGRENGLLGTDQCQWHADKSCVCDGGRSLVITLRYQSVDGVPDWYVRIFDSTGLGSFLTAYYRVDGDFDCTGVNTFTLVADTLTTSCVTWPTTLTLYPA